MTPNPKSHVLNSTQSGFTLVELMVTISIYVILSSVVIANYRDYRTDAISSNSVEDAILALRQMQVYGTGGRGCGNPPYFTCRYGVHFSTVSPENKGFIVFVDNDNGGVPSTFDATDTILETVTWTDPSTVSSICTTNSNDPTTYVCNFDKLSITFLRPSPDAKIGGLDYNYGKISISNGLVGPLLKIRTITISRAGQISLETI